ncbi:type IV pilus assembly protein PilM [Marinobacterium sp. BA1]|uniref:type IV pilus assembly protein PilM n=1 Tax=Marinobacterium sp. BA1 TaxID=3138931 RepID=UPI0032E58611
MLSIFKKKVAGWVGVDIGSSSVKLVALTKHGQSYQIEGYAIVSLPPASVVDGNVEVVADVSDAIERAVKLCGVKLSHAVTSVPASAVITKKIEVSKAFSGLELEDQVRVEADQFIPYPLNEVALDFEAIGDADNSPGLQEVLLVACRKKDVDSREDAISGAGLSCEIVDVDTYAVERVLPFLESTPTDGQITGVIDIGAATLTLNVFRGDRIIYNREQAFGGNDLVNLIHQVKGLGLTEVERLLATDELDQESKESLIEPFKSTVAQQVSRALQFFYSSGARAGQIGKLYLAGGTSRIESLAEAVEQETGLPTRVANPFEQMGIVSKVNPLRLEKDAPRLFKACGLALRSFDV